MAMNKQNGNMYPWVTHTWNPLGGECPHRCGYCYARPELLTNPTLKKKYSEKPFLAASMLKDNLGKGNTIFVQNMGDLFAEEIPTFHIMDILEHLNKYPDNTYLLQTKNPRRIANVYMKHLPPKRIIATTLETDNLTGYKDTKAPSIRERAEIMESLSQKGERVIISIEPIMEFRFPLFVAMIRAINPEFVSIGADSKKSGLPEPSAGQVRALIAKLGEFTIVRVKDNLKRLNEGVV